MKSATLLLLVTISLSACAPECSDHHLKLIAPDVKKYPQSVLKSAADEIDGGKCPVLSNTMLPDYFICRQQSRAIK